MKAIRYQLTALAVATAFVFITPATSMAQEKAKDKGKSDEKAKGKGDEKSQEKKGPPGAIPYTGKAVAVDKTAKTIKLSGEAARVLHITSQTRIVKDGKPATLDDLKEGEAVAGQYRKGEGDKLEAISIRIGPAPAGGEKDKAKDKAKDKKDEKK